MTIISRSIICVALALTVVACGQIKVATQSNTGNQLRAVNRAIDLNPDPRVVEIELTAAASEFEFLTSQPTTVWAFNGQVPGPQIEANVGDEVIVHFKNMLPEATTIHWHGIRLTPEMDGSHVSQSPVVPGNSFAYRFVVPDAGLYWYHPHHNGSNQVARGLYGPLLVRGIDEPQLTRERTLVLSDALLDDRRQLIPSDQVTHTPLVHALGVEGNVALVNGQLVPNIQIAPGSRERWRIVNAATSQYFRLAIPGHKFHLIGADGGYTDQVVELSELTLATGERADIIVSAPLEIASAELVALPYSRIFDQLNYFPPPVELLARIHFSGKPTATPPLPAALGNYPMPADVADDKFFQFIAMMSPAIEDVLRNPLGVSMVEHGQDGGEAGEASFGINGKSFPDVPLVTARLGTWELWTLNNHTLMEHPFHLHGFRFLVRDIDGVEPEYRVWKDTLNLPVGPAGNGRVNVLVDFSGHPGRWVYHCHILHHQELGMMAEVEVTE